MKVRFIPKCGYLLILFSLILPCTLLANQRSVFLNGIDISSAKHQILENVTVRIDGQGQIFIEAPHYEVNEESTYIPLSTWNREEGRRPRHDNTGAIPSNIRNLGPGTPVPGAESGEIPVKKILEPQVDQQQKGSDEYNPTPLPGNTYKNSPGTTTPESKRSTASSK